MTVPAKTSDFQDRVPAPADQAGLPPAPNRAFPTPRPAPRESVEEQGLELSFRKSNFLGLFALLLLVGGLGSWAAFAEISGAVIAQGELDVEQSRQIVQHVDGGIIDDILVAEGDRVEAGQILLRIDGSRARAELAIVEAQYLEAAARIARLSAERDQLDEIAFPASLLEAAETRPYVAELLSGQVSLFEARLKTHRQRIEQFDQLRNQIMSLVSGIDAQIGSAEQQLEIARNELQTQEDLVQRGLTTNARLSFLQREVAEHAGNLGDLVARRAEAMERVASTALDSLSLVATRQEEAIAQLRELSVSGREAAERLQVTRERMARLDVRAPTAGIIYDLNVNTTGAVIGAAEALMYIVPQDQPMVAVSRIEANDIDRVYVGQSVNLQISAFSSRIMQAINGEIIHVSAATFHDDQSRQSYYRARIRIDAEDLKILGGRQLVPGMQVVAFIEAEARSPASYLLNPLADYFSRSFRE